MPGCEIESNGHEQAAPQGQGQQFDPGKGGVTQMMDAPENGGRVASAVDEARKKDFPRSETFGQSLDGRPDSLVDFARPKPFRMLMADDEPEGIVDESAGDG